MEASAFAFAAQLLAAWSFILGGLFAWARRPDNRFGPLLTAVGLAVFVGALGASNESLPFTLGWTFGGVFIAVFIHALLAFPRGYLETRLVYTIVGIAYVERDRRVAPHLLLRRPRTELHRLPLERVPDRRLPTPSRRSTAS